MPSLVGSPHVTPKAIGHEGKYGGCHLLGQELQAGASSGLPPVLGNFCSNTFMPTGLHAGLLSGFSSRGELVPLSVLQGLNYLLSGPVSDFGAIVGWILNVP